MQLIQPIEYIFRLNLDVLNAIISAEPFLQSSTILSDANKELRTQVGVDFRYLRAFIKSHLAEISDRYTF